MLIENLPMFMKVNIKAAILYCSVFIASLMLWSFRPSSDEFDFEKEHTGFFDFIYELKNRKIALQDARKTLICPVINDKITIQSIDKEYAFCILKFEVKDHFLSIVLEGLEPLGVRPDYEQRFALKRKRKDVYMNGAVLSTENQRFRFINMEDFKTSSGGMLQLPVFQIIDQDKITKK